MYEELKKKRTELGKTLEEIAEQTKIKKSCLIAIEEGKFDEMPTEVYTRAYIKMYAETLGVDPFVILKDYDEYLKSKKQNVVTISRIESKPEKKKSDKKSFSFSWKMPTWGVTAVIILAVIVIVVLFLQLDKKDQTIPPPPPVTQTPLSTESEIAKLEEKAEQKQETVSQQQLLKIEATDKVWMRITIDDKEKKEFLLNPGQTVELQANKSFKLHIGNAGGVKVLFNNKELDRLGETGQVVYLDLPQDKN